MRRALTLALALTAALDALAGTGRIVIVNTNSPGQGFNDPTPATPVGGNDGTTLGAQRLNVFNAAAATWSRALDIKVDILVGAAFKRIGSCTETSGVLGHARPESWHRDFTNAPLANTWYPAALANQLSGKDLAATRDIFIEFNSDVDNATCLGASNWYYGLDNQEGANVDLFVVVLHEIAHGLGVSANGFDGGFPASTDLHKLDLTTGRRWHQMTAAERATSLTNTANLVWDGDHVREKTRMFLQPTTLLTVTEPSTVARNYDIGMAAFGPAANTTGIAGRLVRVVDPADEAGASANDGCSAFTNASAISGNVALVDRGNCTFVQKARNAQAAGAAAVVVVDNKKETCLPPGMSGDAADITIPVISITQDDGDKLKAELTNNANVSGFTRNDPSQLAGTSREGYVRLYAPCVNEPGSSVHHWDTPSTPNLLMEPSINGDLRHGLDLTLYQLLDIGWQLPPRTGRRFSKR